MDNAAHKRLVRELLKSAGTSYAEEAGIRRHADAAVSAVDPVHACEQADRRDERHSGRATMISAFGRAHYVRYDESSATRLTDIAAAVSDGYDGDLRGLAGRSGHDVKAAARLLKQFKGIGETGADIYLREVQDVWPWVRPHFDKRAVQSARQLGLPTDAEELGALSPRSGAKLAAALVRVSLDDELRDKVASQR